jgi:hypothetical protein
MQSGAKANPRFGGSWRIRRILIGTVASNLYDLGNAFMISIDVPGLENELIVDVFTIERNTHAKKEAKKGRDHKADRRSNDRPCRTEVR